MSIAAINREVYKFSIAILTEAFEDVSIDAETKEKILEAVKEKVGASVKGKVTRKSPSYNDTDRCTASTKSGKRCSKKLKENGLCNVHLKSQAKNPIVEEKPVEVPKEIFSDNEEVEELSSDIE